MHHHPLDFLSGLARRYGDVCHFRSGSQHVFLVSHPDLVKELMVTQGHNFTKGRTLGLAQSMFGSGLLTSDGGEQHLAHRRAIQPGMRTQRIGNFARQITDYSRAATQRWEDGQTLDVFAEMLELTLRIFSKVLFDLDYAREAPEMRAATYRILAAFELTVKPLARWWARLPTGTMLRYRKARAVVEATVRRMMRERREGGDRGDLLSVLMGRHRSDGTHAELTERQVLDEIYTFLIAGNYTTAILLTWTWYLLARHPAVEERLRSELDGVLCGSPPATESVDQLRYTRMVLCEVLRMYPPVWVSGRQAVVNCELGGFRIPAGALVMASQYVVHRDPRFFPDPERFDPDRWTPEAEARRPRHSFFPFAAGVRSCLGESFAWLEAILILAVIAQQWRLRVTPGSRVKAYPGVVLRPKDGLLMTAHKRDHDGIRP